MGDVVRNTGYAMQHWGITLRWLWIASGFFLHSWWLPCALLTLTWKSNFTVFWQVHHCHDNLFVGKWLLVILYLAISLVLVFYCRFIWASGVKSTRNCTELPYYLNFAKQKRNRALSTEDIFLFIIFICYSVLFNVLSKMVVQFQAWSNRIPKSFSYSKL